MLFFIFWNQHRWVAWMSGGDGRRFGLEKVIFVCPLTFEVEENLEG
jgi:hypothetical protein